MICLFSSLYETLWRRANTEETGPYLAFPDKQGLVWRTWLKSALIRLCSWILLFTNFVPISMMVTLETVRFAQGYFMQSDYKMYDLDKDMPVKV